jgi:hypothetical protein
MPYVAKAHTVNHDQTKPNQALICEAIHLLAVLDANREMTREEPSRGLGNAPDEIIYEVLFYLVSRTAWLSA